MEIINELYLLPDGDQYILYAPLNHTILKVNKGLVALLNKIKQGYNVPQDKTTLTALENLKKLGIINGEDRIPQDPNPNDEYLPTSVTFLPTSDCNLKCIYCYANSGTYKKYLPVHIGKAAIDFICKNAKIKGVENIQIGFLGGGEPFLAWDFVTQIYEYTKIIAERNGLTTFFTGVTNGVLPQKKVLWIREHFQFLNVSLDGLKSIHDKQRPTKNGNSSYDKVIDTISLLNEVNFEYSIRSTVSAISVKSLPSIVEFFSKELCAIKIHLEPLFSCGRCRTSGDLAPNPSVFSEKIKKCYPIAASHKTELLCSSARLDNFSSTYCGALVENFYITPEGFVTACTEVSSDSEPLSNTFLIGKYDQTLNKFIIWDEKRRLLMSRTVNSIDKCQKCISKWHCSGGCPVKAYRGNVFNDVDIAGCIISRELTEYHVRLLASGKTEYFPRIEVNVV